VFVPMLAAHAFRNATAWFDAAVAALAFSLVASAVYVINDLIDVEADRAHPRKAKRPFASGALPLTVGIGLVPFLLLAPFLLAAQVGSIVTALLAGYLALNLAYTWRLKELIVVDTVLLATFYTLRILVGGAATG